MTQPKPRAPVQFPGLDESLRHLVHATDGLDVLHAHLSDIYHDAAEDVQGIALTIRILRRELGRRLLPPTLALGGSDDGE